MTVRLVQISDIHFGGEDPAAVEATLDYLQGSPPDLTLVTGDLTLNGLPSEFREAGAWLKRLPLPRLCTPGNHDTPYWNLALRALVPFERYRHHIGRVRGELYVGDGFAARMINTARGAQPRMDWSKGAIDLEMTEEIISSLAATPNDTLRIVGCHHPLMEVKGAPVTGSVHRGAKAAEMLALGGVDLVLTGHIHNPFAIALPYGDSHTYAVGAGTLSLRTRGTPPSFNVIEADAVAVEITAMGWNGKGLEVLQTWRLPRRSLASPPSTS
ncbi:metallophosphoesterase [Caulobacter sp. S45]|uniref:metallophosphoesterase family protein n=1 Tax=Caulobacter sp. S45 TaxID=1641861 RepID=UPI00131B4E9E|nr:metallophosphoesterase [Caulobacter sp. S45]